ncbi:hypothetical protein ACNSPU_06335 [Bacillus velezensis]
MLIRNIMLLILYPKLGVLKKAPPINIYATETEVFNGKIYLVGGQTKEVVQGHIRSDLNEYIYEYDPVLDRWNRKKFLGPLQNTSTAVLNNKIYIIGGRKNPSVIEPLTKVYDPIKDEISVEKPYPFERYDARIAAVGDNLYLFWRSNAVWICIRISACSYSGKNRRG